MTTTIKFDGDLTLGDLEDFEDYTGMAASDMANMEGTPPTKVLTAMIWISMRTQDPTFTIEAARASKLTDFEFDIGDEDEDADPEADAGAQT